MTGRRWHPVHGDGREWTADELAEAIRAEREHDGLWPYDARLWGVSLDDECRCVYLLDSCQHWHVMGRDDDMGVVWDE